MSAHLLAQIDQLKAENAAIREEYAGLMQQLASPPPGWHPFGWHAQYGGTPYLEFWGQGADGLPIWERRR